VRRLLVVTQAVDPAHPALAATVPKLRALAERVDELVVLADRTVEGVLPPNVRLLSFAAGSRVGRGLRFEGALARELGRAAAPVLVHMVPLHALLAAPLVRARRQPLLLWYTQWHAGRALRLAERVVTGVLTVDRGSFPLDSPKVRAIGHGIDVDAFPCRPRGESFSALALGRYARVKGYETVIRAAAAAGVPLRVHGPMLNAAELAERARLEAVAAAAGGDVRLGEALPQEGVRDAFAAAGVLVSNTVPGAADKVVLEAAASGVPVLAPPAAFPGLLPDELRFAHDDEPALAARLAWLAGLDAGARSALGTALRGRVEADHSVGTWADRVLESARV
jgi:glycosyltransferase involved in cell wall biosynthesis